MNKIKHMIRKIKIGGSDKYVNKIHKPKIKVKVVINKFKLIVCVADFLYVSFFLTSSSHTGNTAVHRFSRREGAGRYPRTS